VTTGSTSRRKGKRVELEIAHALGTQRNKSDGTSHTDIYTDEFAVEVKARKSLPAWIESAMQQAVDDPSGLLPAVVLVESRVGQKPQKYALIRFEDFVRLTGGIPTN
jgi:hypothetical protein